MREIGLNVVRIYHAPPRWFSTACAAAGIRVAHHVPWKMHIEFLARKMSATIRSPGLFAIRAVNQGIPLDVQLGGTVSLRERHTAETTPLATLSTVDGAGRGRPSLTLKVECRGCTTDSTAVRAVQRQLAGSKPLRIDAASRSFAGDSATAEARNELADDREADQITSPARTGEPTSRHLQRVCDGGGRATRDVRLSVGASNTARTTRSRCRAPARHVQPGRRRELQRRPAAPDAVNSAKKDQTIHITVGGRPDAPYARTSRRDRRESGNRYNGRRAVLERGATHDDERQTDCPSRTTSSERTRPVRR